MFEMELPRIRLPEIQDVFDKRLMRENFPTFELTRRVDGAALRYEVRRAESLVAEIDTLPLADDLEIHVARLHSDDGGFCEIFYSWIGQTYGNRARLASAVDCMTWPLPLIFTQQLFEEIADQRFDDPEQETLRREIAETVQQRLPPVEDAEPTPGHFESTADLEACVLCLEDGNGQIRGTGFVLNSTLAVTCVHVVEACGAGPSERVRLAFRAGGALVEAEALADSWHPRADVAFLRLAAPLPHGVMPAVLGSSADAASHIFRAFGYPGVGDFRGVWAEGQILGRVTGECSSSMLQLRAQEIAPGMSGAPVLDVNADRVVGMVTMTYQPDSTLKFRDAAFAIPAETLRDLCPVALELRPAEEASQLSADSLAHQQQAEGHHIAQADQGSAAIVGDVYGPVVVAGEGAQVTVTVQGENVREKELAYLDGLLTRYEYWRDHYTPLAGIAEVRAAVVDAPRLDLPMPFIPPGFEKLVEHGYGERVQVRREPVDDLRTAVAEYRRIVLLGDPGSGKTTTLWRLVYDYANAARADARAPLPLLVPLGSYTDDGPFDDYLARHLGALAPYLETYRASGRLILLLDGLNEMPRAGYTERVDRIRDVLDRCPDEDVVVTCRALDYVEKLEQLQKVEVSPLDETRIQAFLHNYLDETAGERLFRTIVGRDEVRALWDTWQQAGGTWAEFWTAEKMPLNVYLKTTGYQGELWAHLRKEPPSLLALGRNPYLLLMIAQVYVSAGGELPANRARLFAAFVDTLLRREEKRHPEEWVEAKRQKDGLAALAYAMQAERGRGTKVEREWAVARLCGAVPECDAERLLYLATSAMLLDADDATVRFYHQLLQEYFAAREMGRRVAAGESLDRHWPPDRWWEPSGWEETAILLAGMEPDASALLEGLAAVNPVVAARCLVEGGAQVDETTRRGIAAGLVARMTDGQQPPVARVQAGDALARLGDPRPGVGVDRETGLPDIVWCYIPPGLFVMGDGEQQHRNETITEGYLIARYPITNAQFAVFVEAGGYRERRYWTEVGWQWKGDRTGPWTYGGVFDLPNHPLVGVTWYEAVAFCRWFQEQLQIADCRLRVCREGELETLNLEPKTLRVRLPSEAEWEKVARGTDGRRFPWGRGTDPNRTNYWDAGIETTSPVGGFPGGASPYGVEDLSGNVWEWCRTKWEQDYEDYRNDNDLEGEAIRVLRGGSFRDHVIARCACRSGYLPNGVWGDCGFRVAVSPISPASAL